MHSEKIDLILEELEIIRSEISELKNGLVSLNNNELSRYTSILNNQDIINSKIDKLIQKK